MDVQRALVDEKLLQLENLNYKRAYLRRQIAMTKDHSMPEIAAVENELGCQNDLTLNRYTDDIQEIKLSIIERLKGELADRQAQKAELEGKEAEFRTLNDVLLGKRKFIEELPGTRLYTTTHISPRFIFHRLIAPFVCHLVCARFVSENQVDHSCSLGCTIFVF